MSKVGFLVSSNSLFLGLHCAFTNFTKSCVVDNIPPPPNRTSKSQLDTISPFGFNPFTSLFPKFLELVNKTNS